MPLPNVEPSDNILVYVITLLGVGVASLLALIVWLIRKRKGNGNSKPEMTLQLAEAVRVEIGKDKVLQLFVTSAEHTVQITALRKDVDELKK